MGTGIQNELQYSIFSAHDQGRSRIGQEQEKIQTETHLSEFLINTKGYIRCKLGPTILTRSPVNCWHPCCGSMFHLSAKVGFQQSDPCDNANEDQLLYVAFFLPISHCAKNRLAHCSCVHTNHKNGLENKWIIHNIKI